MTGRWPSRFHRVLFVARGGTCDVYRAFDLVSGAIVALKLPRGGAAAPGCWWNTEREWRFHALFRGHPNVVEPVALLRDPAILVSRFAGGGTVADHRGDRPGLTLEELVSVGRCAASALVALHEVGIVHADIKPQNLFVDMAGTVRLGDFGSAHRVGGRGTRAHTPGFASPEQRSGGPVGVATDVYSLGVSLCSLAGGRVPRVLAEIVSVCSANEPSHRWTAAELWSRLDAIANACGVGECHLAARRDAWADGRVDDAEVTLTRAT